MWNILQREFIYIWYYFDLQLRQILPYWASGMLIGSFISVFGKQKIHSLMTVIQDKHFFNFTEFSKSASRDTDPNIFMRLLKNIGRNIKATGVWFLTGVLLSALFQRYAPADAFASLFVNNRGFGLLMAATIGVPLYACGGTIPLLQQWLANGMSMGSAAAFMITGPAAKITNLGALKIVLGIKHFVLYIIFVIASALFIGFIVNIITSLL